MGIFDIFYFFVLEKEKELKKHIEECAPRIAMKLNLSKSTIDDHFKQLGYVKKPNIWIPHEKFI